MGKLICNGKDAPSHEERIAILRLAVDLVKSDHYCRLTDVTLRDKISTAVDQLSKSYNEL